MRHNPHQGGGVPEKPHIMRGFAKHPAPPKLLCGGWGGNDVRRFPRIPPTPMALHALVWPLEDAGVQGAERDGPETDLRLPGGWLIWQAPTSPPLPLLHRAEHRLCWCPPAVMEHPPTLSPVHPDLGSHTTRSSPALPLRACFVIAVVGCTATYGHLDLCAL